MYLKEQKKFSILGSINDRIWKKRDQNQNCKGGTSPNPDNKTTKGCLKNVSVLKRCGVYYPLWKKNDAVHQTLHYYY